MLFLETPAVVASDDEPLGIWAIVKMSMGLGLPFNTKVNVVGFPGIIALERRIAAKGGGVGEGDFVLVRLTGSVTVKRCTVSVSLSVCVLLPLFERVNETDSVVDKL
jgi:hypothetical protein